MSKPEQKSFIKKAAEAIDHVIHPDQPVSSEKVGQILNDVSAEQSKAPVAALSSHQKAPKRAAEVSNKKIDKHSKFDKFQKGKR